MKKFTEYTRANGGEWEEAEWTAVEPIEAETEEEALRIAIETEEPDLRTVDAKRVDATTFEYYIYKGEDLGEELVTLEFKVEEVEEEE